MPVLTLSPAPVVLGKRRAEELHSPTSSPRFEPASSLLLQPGGGHNNTEGDRETDDTENERSDSDTDAEEDACESSAEKTGSLLKPQPNKPYQCSYPNCTKSYSRAFKLSEHERSHTGVRPYVCKTCSKAYLRDSHLQQHSRTHLSYEERPFLCNFAADTCDKRFWTEQKLKTHIQCVHERAKLFECSAEGCNEAFSKNQQLRTHFVAAHCTPGSKRFPCGHEGCLKSFPTSQKLRNHAKSHELNRYACVHPSCTQSGLQDGSTSASSPTLRYFGTWTELQQHIRVVHPPTCPHAECDGRTFTTKTGLKAHLRLHEQREREAELLHALEDECNGDDGHDESSERAVKRRRGGEIGRDWHCPEDSCDKAFKSKFALNKHVNISHLGLKPFTCPEADCQKTFGYKHVLRQHIEKVHRGKDQENHDEEDDSTTSVANQREENHQGRSLAIDFLTGLHYTTNPESQNNHSSTGRDIHCPWPDAFQMHLVGPSYSTPAADDEGGTKRYRCAYMFSRAYDLARHLHAEHGVRELDMDGLVAWVAEAKKNNHNRAA
ncbi:uncharacterized protein EI90DRAFT_2917034 [Cantharellus anzutake]|uniref:uncharacterized protein n=1 Tax=Cantharellus anzutake TaxID=1750568 RepID=UPI001903D1BA|nr:uncharacterized protein EI90DRAFT_2917034 [Cantharellus anzutake]KAF8333064.1 hypothetical protein EI90DRAFT_2917034 [Cantharellus anzutake]